MNKIIVQHNYCSRYLVKINNEVNIYKNETINLNDPNVNF